MAVRLGSLLGLLHRLWRSELGGLAGIHGHDSGRTGECPGVTPSAEGPVGWSFMPRRVSHGVSSQRTPPALTKVLNSRNGNNILVPCKAYREQFSIALALLLVLSVEENLWLNHPSN